MKKFLIVISVILLIAIISVATVGCKKPTPPDIKPLDIDAGEMPDMACQILPAELAIIDAGLDEDATDAEKKAAVLELFNAADRIQREADLLFTVSDGGGYAKTGAEGYMTVRGFYFRNEDAYYSQSVGQVTSANLGTIAATDYARNLLDQLSRTYTSDMQTFYRDKAEDGEHANRPNVTASESFPYTSADFSGCASETFNLDDWKEESRILNEVGELSNFDFNTDAIKNALIVKNNAENLYRIEFELDTSNKNEAYDNVVDFAREGLREASKSTDLDYEVYKVVVEIWTNGYIRSFSTVENWEASLKVVSFLPTIHGVSDSSNLVVYFWDWDEVKDVIDDCEDYEEIETADEFLDALKWFE